MTRYLAFGACCCLLIGACSRGSPEAGSNAQTSLAPAKNAPSAPLTPTPAGCSDQIEVVLDRPSLIDAGDRPFPAPRLAAFEGNVAASFHAAADQACKTAAVRQALAPVRRIVVQSGSGAADPTFFLLNEHMDDALVFQWPFNEAGLGVPARKDIESGLRCWADPNRKECADMGD